MFGNGENTDTKENTEIIYVDPKHEKYLLGYKPNSLYWGIGIENEVYLEFEKKHEIKKQDLITKRKRERYSVDYYTNYKKKWLDEAIRFYINNQTEGTKLSIPILLNANSFTKTDKYNNSITLYTSLRESNPKFSGETLIETLQQQNEYFQNTIGNQWLFDGDTIEFNTLNFFNANLHDVTNELCKNKREFITNLNATFSKINAFNEYGNIKIMEKNHPFSSFMTNFKNITMFNNGTLHYNITLPTYLDAKCNIQNTNSFIKTHKRAIKIIQWMEPFILAVYGSPDPFSNMEKFQNKGLFTNASQRGAISRYIGIGTYNTDEMIKGKILKKSVSELACNSLEYWWYHEFYKNNAYTKLYEMGIDINFNKHYNHGIEIRFLDHIHDTEKLYESFEFIIYLMDIILENDSFDNLENPIFNKLWNNVVLKTMIHGKTGLLNTEEKQMYEKIFNMTICTEQINDVYYEIFNELIIRFNKISITSLTNTYTLTPIGTFSQKALNVQCKTIKDKKIIHCSVSNTNDVDCLPSIKEIPKINPNTNRNNPCLFYLVVICIAKFFCNKQ
jgi:hypothetical protein